MVQRQPSIHITEQQLTAILTDLGFVTSGPISWNTASLAKAICEKAKTYTLTHRGIQITNDKLDKKADKILASTRSDAFLFSETLSLCRKKAQHRGIRAVKPGESDWLIIKDLAKLALEFCQEFSIPSKSEGFKQYITIALSKLKQYSLNRIKPLHSAICVSYEALSELKNDSAPDDTETMYLTYLKKINEKIGHSFDDYKNIPEKYVCFIKARETADTLKINYQTYIDAQFHALEWVNAIPDPLQIYGSKAIERVRKYCFEKNINLKENTKKVNFKKIANNA